MRIKGKKATIGITLPPELVLKAKDHGLNISKVAENALIKAITALERMDEPNESQNHPVSYLRMDESGPGRIRTGDFRLVKAAS